MFDTNRFVCLVRKRRSLLERFWCSWSARVLRGLWGGGPDLVWNAIIPLVDCATPVSYRI